MEKKRVGGGGAGFSTGIHYCPTTDIKLVWLLHQILKTTVKKDKNTVALK